MPIMRKKLNAHLATKDERLAKGHELYSKAAEQGTFSRTPLYPKEKARAELMSVTYLRAARGAWHSAIKEKDLAKKEMQRRASPRAGFVRKVVATSDAFDRREARRRQVVSGKKKHSIFRDLRRIWGAGRK